MQLAPGVTGRGTASPMSGDFASYTRTMTTEVSGSMVGSTSIMLDGADVTSGGGYEGELRAFQIPPDAVGELKLEATNASAEFGRSGGGRPALRSSREATRFTARPLSFSATTSWTRGISFSPM